MDEESLDNIPLPPTASAEAYNDAGLTVRALEQVSAGAVFYDQTWRAIRTANPDWSDQQVTDALTVQIRISDWNAQYQNIIKDIACSNSVEERERKIKFYESELDSFKASGIPVDNDLQYLRSIQGVPGNEIDPINQELNVSLTDAKPVNTYNNFGIEFQELWQYNYETKLGPTNPAAVDDYEEGEIPEEKAVEYAIERESAAVSSFVETVKEIGVYLNKPILGNASQMTEADLEAGYQEIILVDGITRVRVIYGDSGGITLHPEDSKLYEGAMDNYRKAFTVSALMQGAGPFLFSGAKNILDKFSKAPGPKLVLEEAQFGQKIGKHAQDFGLNPGIPQSRQWLKELITDIHTNPNEIRQGPWRGLGEIMTNGNRAEGMALFYRKGSDVVITDLKGNFVTILKDGALQNLRFKNAQNIFGTPLE